MTDALHVLREYALIADGWGGYYEPRSLIWRSRFVTSSNAIVECREARALPSHRSRAVILRRIVAARGTSRIAITLNPCAGFGRHPLRRLRRRDSGEWDAMLGGVHVCVAGASTAVAIADERGEQALRLTIELHEDQAHDVVLTLDAAASTPVDPATAWSQTEAGWRERAPRLPDVLAPRDSEARRCCSSRWRRAAIACGPTTGSRRASPRARSKHVGASPMPASGSSSRTRGRTAG